MAAAEEYTIFSDKYIITVNTDARDRKSASFLILALSHTRLSICPPSRKFTGSILKQKTTIFTAKKTYVCKEYFSVEKIYEIIAAEIFTTGPAKSTNIFFDLSSGYEESLIPNKDRFITGFVLHNRHAMICPVSCIILLIIT